MPNAVFVCHPVLFLPHHHLLPALACRPCSTSLSSVIISVLAIKAKKGEKFWSAGSTGLTAGFTIVPSFVALVHKKLYVGHYLSCCTRFGEEPPRRPLTRPHLPSVSLFFLPCHFLKRERHTMMARGYGHFYHLWCCHP